MFRGKSVGSPISASLGTWVGVRVTICSRENNAGAAPGSLLGPNSTMTETFWRVEGVVVRGSGVGFRVESVWVWGVGFSGEVLEFRVQGSVFKRGTVCCRGESVESPSGANLGTCVGLRVTDD